MDLGLQWSSPYSDLAMTHSRGKRRYAFEFDSETPVVAVDCEMVEIDRSSNGLAR